MGRIKPTEYFIVKSSLLKAFLNEEQSFVKDILYREDNPKEVISTAIEYSEIDMGEFELVTDENYKKYGDKLKNIDINKNTIIARINYNPKLTNFIVIEEEPTSDNFRNIGKGYSLLVLTNSDEIMRTETGMVHKKEFIKIAKEIVEFCKERGHGECIAVI